MIYEYKCWDCGIIEEHEHSMKSMHKYKHKCPKCSKVMPRYYSTTQVIFKGDGWIDKELRRKKEDAKIEEARQKAGRLKDSGAVPWDEQIKINQAPGMYDRLGTEMRKKEAEKAKSGKLDKEMDGLVTNE